MPGVEVDGFPLGRRPGLPQRGDRDHDQLRVYGREGRVVDAELAFLPGRLVLDEHVGRAQQVKEEFEPFGAVEIEHDAALVAVQKKEQSAFLGVGFVARKRPQLTGRVATGGLHLYNVGAVVGQQLGAEGCRDAFAKLDHANS